MRLEMNLIWDLKQFYKRSLIVIFSKLIRRLTNRRVKKQRYATRPKNSIFSFSFEKTNIDWYHSFLNELILSKSSCEVSYFTDPDNMEYSGTLLQLFVFSLDLFEGSEMLLFGSSTKELDQYHDKVKDNVSIYFNENQDEEIKSISVKRLDTPYYGIELVSEPISNSAMCYYHALIPIGSSVIYWRAVISKKQNLAQILADLNQIACSVDFSEYLKSLQQTS